MIFRRRDNPEKFHINSQSSPVLISLIGVDMSRNFDREPLYLCVARWVMQQKTWVCAQSIAEQFGLPLSKAVNTVSYILAEVNEITCSTKTVPNQLAGRGCQCQRLLRVEHIDDSIEARLLNAVNIESIPTSLSDRITTAIPPGKLNREEKWQWLLSKSVRK